MSFKKVLLAIVPVVVIAATGYFVTAASDDAQSLKFMMAHKPDNADNVALIQKFAENVYKRTEGEVRIEPVIPRYPNEEDGSVADIPLRALEDVADGDVLMAQISVKRFSDMYPELFPLNALDAPRVFRTHDHAAQVLDGDVGQDLLALTSEQTNGTLKGLGFTYSGGYRNIFATVPVNSLADLANKKMRGVSAMSHDVMDALQIDVDGNVRYRSPEWEAGMVDGSVPLEEAENLRIASYRGKVPHVTDAIKTVVETNHSMYLTMLVANGDAFDSLTAEQQAIIEEEAYALALAERELSIQQADEIKAQFESEGVHFLALTPAEVAQLEQIAANVRATYKDVLGTWFDRIEATQ